MSKAEYSAEERAAYFRGLREKWTAAKKLSQEDGGQAAGIIAAHGLNVSLTGFVCVQTQMKALGLAGLPYIDAKTFMGWKESGFVVKKGERCQITGITWIGGQADEEPDGDEDGEGAEKSRRLWPKVYYLFHRSQVEELTR